jgi:type IV pilus assembly protein PilB
MVAGRPRLGAFLIEQHIITEEQLDAAMQHQVAGGVKLGQALIDLGLCSDRDIARALADQLEIPFVDLDDNPPDVECLTLVPREVALEFGILPIQRQGSRLLVAALDPYDIRLDEALRQATGLHPILAMAPATQLRKQLLEHYSDILLEEPVDGKVNEITNLNSQEQEHLAVHRLVAAGEQVSAVAVVNSLIADAVRRGASDLHLEPEPDRLRVRCRIDGRMVLVTSLPGELIPSINARLKIMSGMDISESRRPQDGGCSLRVDSRAIELRVSTLRGVHGEIAVLRVLYKDSGMHELDALGFQPGMLRDLHSLLAARNGMFLVTGPTGSGKSTSLYAAVSHLNRDDINIITIEDPVESKLAGVNQIQTHDRAGRTFAASLRSVLRQDPDVIMVGEIRDVETAEIACRAALTGHLVLSSLHTQHALGAVARLLDIGLEPWIVASCLNGVLAQRLVRRNCEQCAESYVPSQGLQKAFEVRLGGLGNTRFRRGRGCPACHHTGYRGRIGVYELLNLDDTMRELIIRGPHLTQLKEYILQRGFSSMEEDALQKTCVGLIPPEEIIDLGLSLAMEVQERESGAAMVWKPATGPNPCPVRPRHPRLLPLWQRLGRCH